MKHKIIAIIFAIAFMSTFSFAQPPAEKKKMDNSKIENVKKVSKKEIKEVKKQKKVNKKVIKKGKKHAKKLK